MGLPSVWEAIKKQGMPEKPHKTLSQGDGKSISKLLSEHCFHFAKLSHIPGFPEPENLMLELFEEGQKFFKCRVCGKVGKRKDNLLAHIETHLPTKPQTAAVLDSMILVAEGDHPVFMKYTCSNCGKQLPDRRDMKRHCETHLDITHICEMCQKVCKTRNALRQHYSAYHKP